MTINGVEHNDNNVYADMVKSVFGKPTSGGLGFGIREDLINEILDKALKDKLISKSKYLERKKIIFGKQN